MSDVVEPVVETVEMQHGCPVINSAGQRVLLVARDQYINVVKALADDGFDMCVDLTGVDYLNLPHRTVGADISAERFEVVVNLLPWFARWLKP